MPVEIIRENLLPYANITQVRPDGPDIIIHYANKRNKKFNPASILVSLEKRGWIGHHTSNAHNLGGIIRISMKPSQKILDSLLSFVE
ncbi:hypothetical protein HY994_05860 [Candidatus Micrarchaeota archaeon]|nr:hypothetical protein [Candidatus Micrarchaeota archaeon]